MLRSSKFSRRYRRSESRKSYLSIILESFVFVGGRVRPNRQAPARVEGSSFSRINVPTEGRSQRSQNNAEGSNGGRLWDQRSENVVLFQVSQLSRATPCFPHSLDPSPPPLSPPLPSHDPSPRPIRILKSLGLAANKIFIPPKNTSDA